MDEFLYFGRDFAFAVKMHPLRTDVNAGASRL